MSCCADLRHRTWQALYRRPMEDHFIQLTAGERLFNRAFGIVVRMGLGLPHNYLLEVKGRKSGKRYSVPVDILSLDGRRYLVSGRGLTQWVRNARAAGGAAKLIRGRHNEVVVLRELSASAKPAVLKAYVERYRLTVQRYFTVAAGAPIEDFATVAQRHPAFEILAEVAKPNR